ncbi:MAG: hypothetical protein LBU77_05065, partial [Clostridiales bacterium]|nr:hypothetical protein [Clostridiales bacterium]
MRKRNGFTKRVASLMAVVLFAIAFGDLHMPLIKADDSRFNLSQEYAIQTSRDDCAINTTAVNFTSTGIYAHGLYSNNVPQDTYLRFATVSLPADAVITNAYLSFTVRDAVTTPPSIRITGEMSGGSAFESTVSSFSNRSFTTAASETDMPRASAGAKINTADISGVMNEMRTTNAALSAYVFKIVGSKTGQAIMRSYDYGSAYAPKLIVEYNTAYAAFETVLTDRTDAAEEYGTSHAVAMDDYVQIGGYLATSLTADNKQSSAFRFRNIEIPDDVEVTNAYVEYRARTTGVSGRISNMTVKAELGDAAAYSTRAYDLSNRTYSQSSVRYAQGMLTRSEIYRTPNLKDLINENIWSGWESGQSMAFLFDGDNYIGAAYSQPTNNPPKLVIEYKAAEERPVEPTNPEELENIYINEVSNGTDTFAEPWAEIYNDNDYAVVLGEGVFLSDDTPENRYEFERLMIPAKGFRPVALNGGDGFAFDNSDHFQSVERIGRILIHQVYGGG